MSSKGDLAHGAIVDAARMLFYRQGYASTSVAEIAQQAGLEKGHLTYYFPNKSALLLAVAQKERECFMAAMTAWDAGQPTPLAAAELFIGMVEGQRNDLAQYGCPIGTITSELGKAQPELQQVTRQVLSEFVQWLTKHLALQMPRKQAQDRAEQLVAMAQGAAVLGHAQRDPSLVLRHCRLMREWLREVVSRR